MSLTYRSSFSFSKPFNFTISHPEIEDALYHHKKRLSINQRSTSRDNNYKTQRLSIEQARTIENLAKKSKAYSLNTLLKSYNRNWDQDNKEDAHNSNLRPNPQHSKGNKMKFQTIESRFFQTASEICPQKMRLFKQGVNYRSKQRSRGIGVKKLNIKDLEIYFDRTPQQESDLFEPNSDQKQRNPAEFNQNRKKNRSQQFSFNRVKSHRIVN